MSNKWVYLVLSLNKNILVHHQGFEQLSKSESIEKWRFDTLPDSSVSTSVSILVDVAVGAYMVEKVLRVFLMKAVSDIAVMMITKTIIYTRPFQSLCKLRKLM